MKRTAGVEIERLIQINKDMVEDAQDVDKDLDDAEKEIALLKEENRKVRKERDEYMHKWNITLNKAIDEKAEIKKQAEGYQQEYEDINVFDDQFDMTDAFLSIAIAMFGITALTQKKWLLYFAGSVSLLGILLGLTAFMHISLHSDLISKILG